jgi:hypothetical protein
VGVAPSEDTFLSVGLGVSVTRSMRVTSTVTGMRSITRRSIILIRVTSTVSVVQADSTMMDRLMSRSVKHLGWNLLVIPVPFLDDSAI